MPAIVSDVIKGSIADELGIRSGDILLSIDNVELEDMIDYNYLCKNENITILIEKTNGEIEEIELEKDFDEDLGIVFDSAVFDKVKPCLNKCIFCFVDQQPKGLRKTLYIKDDDYRLSYMQGTYITLTNLSEKDKERILKFHLGPFYVSIHTTNPDLRVKMLKNPRASYIMNDLKWFKKNQIPFHAQIVLCPGYNDGKELQRTLEDLKKLGKVVLSVAIVPLGITKYRNNKLKTVDKSIAIETIEIANKYKKTYCSDEFFIKAGMEIPKKKYYDKFSQLDDGVGALRTIMDDFEKQKLPSKISKPVNICIACSVASKSVFEKISEKLNNIENLTVGINPIKSKYWGEEITVAGLITSVDLIEALEDTNADYIFIPSIMFRKYTNEFLDGKTLDDVIQIIKKNFIITNKNYSVSEIIDFINLYAK